MDIMNDPIGTKYGCTQSYDTSYTNRFTPLSVPYDENECGTIAGDQVLATARLKPQWDDKSDWYVAANGNLTFNNAKKLKVEKTNDLGDGYIEDVYEEFDATKYSNVVSLENDVIRVTPKPQLFISDAIFVSDHEQQSLYYIRWTNNVGNLTTYVAVSSDRKKWFSYKDSKWVEVDLTQDYDSLKNVMGETINSADSMYSKVLENPLKKFYIAILAVPTNTTSIVPTYITPINIYPDQNRNSFISVFNFVKVGYTPRGVKLIADRNLHTRFVPYSIYYYSITNFLDMGERDKYLSTKDYNANVRLIQSKVSESNSYVPYDEWDELLNFTETGGKSAKEFWHIDGPSLTGGLDVDNLGVNANINITRGSEDDPAAYKAIANTVTGFRPVVEMVRSGHEIVIPGKPPLKEVHNLKDIVKGTCISCDFLPAHNHRVAGYGAFANLGRAVHPLYSDGQKIDYNDSMIISPGSFYFICIGYTNKGEPMLVPDRPLAASGSPSNFYNEVPRQNLLPHTAWENVGYVSENSIITMDGVALSMRLINSNPAVNRDGIFDEFDRIFTNELAPSLKPEELWHHDKTYTLVNGLYNDNARQCFAFRDIYGRFRYYQPEARNYSPVLYEFDKYMTWRPIVIINKIPRVTYMQIDRPTIQYDDTEFGVNIEAVDENFEPIEYALKLEMTRDKDIISDYSIDKERMIYMGPDQKKLISVDSSTNFMTRIGVYVKVNNVETMISYFWIGFDMSYRNEGNPGVVVPGYNYDGIQLDNMGVIVTNTNYSRNWTSVPGKVEFKTAHGAKYIDVNSIVYHVRV